MVNFQVIKVDSPYSMLLKKPWLYIVGVITSTFHRRLKFISENQLITIMAEKPITIFQETSIPYIDANVFLEASFHSFELVSMIHNVLNLEFGWSAVLLMAAKEMLKFSYKLGQGLGAVGCGSPALIELSDNKGRFDLGYEPTHEELFQASRGKKRKCNTSGMSTPHFRTTFLAPIGVIMPEPFKELEDEELHLACNIWLRCEEFSVNAIISLEENPTSTIQRGMPSEAVGLWVIEPCFVVAPAR